MQPTGFAGVGTVGRSVDEGRIVICGLEIEVIWLDEHVVEYRLRAGNGSYAGEAEFYDDHTCFSKIARCFRGFPDTADDRREIVIGTFHPNHGGGGVQLNLSLVDGAGHAATRVRLRTDTAEGSSAEFSFPVEPAGIDWFVRALAGLPTKVGSRAGLEEAT